MVKRIFGSCLLSLLALSILSQPAVASSRKTAALEQKSVEISTLQVKIIDKIDQGIEMRIFLQKRLNELRDEIKIEQNRFRINGHEAPLENLRINYNLNLIQHLRAYIAQLDERIAYFEAGNERLKFYLRQIKDEIAIITTLKDMEIENLVDRINTVLDEFIRETKKPIFDALNIRLVPIEQVWNEIIPKSIETTIFSGS
jgi:chemotaxis protein histidine kinase CheA